MYIMFNQNNRNTHNLCIKMVRLHDAEALGNVEFPFIAIALRSTLAWSGSTW